MSRTAQVRNWLKETALPLWAREGVCPRTGGFVESLSLGGAPNLDETRRVRVQFRQMYVFSHAYALGLAPNGLEVARKGFEFVLAKAWAPDSKPGWVHTLDGHGRVVDDTRDAYDHAFALYGLAWYYRVSRNPQALFAARQTLAYMEEALRAPNGGWLENDKPSSTPRRQNPHMHAFEAMMALFEATSERGFLARAGEHFGLFSSHFFDAPNGLLLEYFEADWTPISCPEGQRIEPGHMAEWVWLLREYQRLTGKPIDLFADAMYQNVLQLGRAQGGLWLADELRMDGQPSKNTRRLWPQTELLKAAVVQYQEHRRPEDRKLAEDLLEGLCAEYLSDEVQGGWNDRFTLCGRHNAQTIPASTFYHIFIAFITAVEALEEEAPRRVVPLKANETAAAFAS